MATTIQNTIDWALGFLGYSTPTVGPNNEPAISNANMVQQVIMAPPFRFPWNRNFTTQALTAGTQDYVINLTDFGYLETCALQDPTSGKWQQIKVLNVTPLGHSSDQQLPATVTVQSTIVGTSATFRFLGVPDKAYVAKLTYQKFVPLMTTLTGGSGTWAMPDYMRYIFNRGFLALCLEAKNPSQAVQEKVAFAAALLATAEGLTETERNIFLAQYLPNSRDLIFMQTKAQQGVQARAS